MWFDQGRRRGEAGLGDLHRHRLERHGRRRRSVVAVQGEHREDDHQGGGSGHAGVAHDPADQLGTPVPARRPGDGGDHPVAEVLGRTQVLLAGPWERIEASADAAGMISASSAVHSAHPSRCRSSRAASSSPSCPSA